MVNGVGFKLQVLRLLYYRSIFEFVTKPNKVGQNSVVQAVSSRDSSATLFTVIYHLPLHIFLLFVPANKHRKSHDPDRPFKCAFCPKAFKFKNKLTAHTVLHTKISKYKCQVCAKIFTCASTLKTHSCKSKCSMLKIHSCEIKLC